MYTTRLQELLAKKLAGEASPDELKELEQLIADHPDGIYYLEAFNELWNEHNDVTIAEAAFERHRRKFADDFAPANPVKEELPVRRLRRAYYWYAAAACVALGLCAAGLLYYRVAMQNAGQQNLTNIIAGKSIRKKLRLPDGTQVWLNSDSRIAFSTDMKRLPQREVTLSGEAFFDVVKDKKHPFVVHTDKIIIKVLGTAFNVKAYPKEMHTEATLLRGMIELTVQDRPQQKFILKPNEKFALTEQPDTTSMAGDSAPLNETMLLEPVQPITVNSKTYTEEVAWTQNELVFKDKTFAELKPAFERWFNVHINIRNKKLAATRLTGSFKFENISDALRALQVITPFNFKIKDHDIDIY